MGGKCEYLWFFLPFSIRNDYPYFILKKFCIIPSVWQNKAHNRKQFISRDFIMREEKFVFLFPILLQQQATPVKPHLLSSEGKKIK